MEQTIIDDLIIKLHETFPEIRAYDMKMEQEIEPPMFQINCYDRRRVDRLTPAGFFYTYFFEVLYFPGNDEPELSIRDIELELQDAVWLFGDVFRADDIRSDTVGGVMHLYFSVTVELKREPVDEPKIEQINSEVNVNEHKILTQTIKATS